MKALKKQRQRGLVTGLLILLGAATVEAQEPVAAQDPAGQAGVVANLGLPLTERGFANFSFEFTNADEASRSVQRADALGKPVRPVSAQESLGRRAWQ